MFIQAKLWNSNHKAEHVEPDLDATLKDLQTDYVDSFVIHWPMACPGTGKNVTLRPNGCFPAHHSQSNAQNLNLFVTQPILSTPRESKFSQNAAKFCQNAVKMQSKCSQNAVKIQSKCSQSAVKMQSKCSQNAVKMQSKCSQNSVKMQSKCSQNSVKM